MSLVNSNFYSDALMEECVRMMQQSMRASPSIKKRAKSVYNQRNLGTIKERKKEKKEQKEVSNGETIMRILRMRHASLSMCLTNSSLTMLLQAQHIRLYRATAPNHERDASRARAAAAAKSTAEGAAASPGIAGPTSPIASSQGWMKLSRLLAYDTTYSA